MREIPSMPFPIKPAVAETTPVTRRAKSPALGIPLPELPELERPGDVEEAEDEDAAEPEGVEAPPFE